MRCPAAGQVPARFPACGVNPLFSSKSPHRRANLIDRIATVVITERANAQLAMELNNEGQVYRMLIKPVRMGSCRLSVDAAISRYWKLKRNPRAIQRFALGAAAAAPQTGPQVQDSLLARIRNLPSRIVQLVRFNT